MPFNLNDQDSIPELTRTQCRADNPKYKVLRTFIKYNYLFHTTFTVLLNLKIEQSKQVRFKKENKNQLTFSVYKVDFCIHCQ